MSEREDERSLGTPAVLVVAAVLSGVVFFLGGAGRASMEDDGFLWYGVKRVLAGEMPLADFTSYDPGRYYWCAAFAQLFGSDWPGVVGGVAVFAALGLAAGTLAARRVVRGRAALVGVAVVLSFWMLPQRKGFEPALAMGAVLVLTRLVELPTARRWLAAGAFVGLAAFFGRNHGVYAAGASLGLLVLLAWKRHGVGPLRALASLGAGVVAGYSPMLLMVALVPGFRAGFLEYLVRVVRFGSNKVMPYPWPWRMVFSLDSWQSSIGRVALVAAFLLPLVVLPLGLVAAARVRREELARRALLVAAPLVGACYYHHVTVASDMPHLAQTVHPALLTALALAAAVRSSGRASLAARAGWTAAGLLFLLPTLNYHGGWAGGRFFDAPPRSIVRFDKPASFESSRPEADDLVRVVRREVPDGETLYVGPHYPGLYVLLDRASPCWLIYVCRPAIAEELQRRTIRELADADWALIGVKRQFRVYVPLVAEHLDRHFERVPVRDLPPGFELLRRRRR